MGRPTRGAYAFTHDDLSLGKHLVEAALSGGDAFDVAYDAANLGARRQKTADLILLLAGLCGVALRLRWPVQVHRPRSDGDVEGLVLRIETIADSSLLDKDLGRVLIRTFVKLDQPFNDPPTSRGSLYTVALCCGVAVAHSLENAGTPSSWDARFHRSFRAVRWRIRVPPDSGT